MVYVHEDDWGRNELVPAGMTVAALREAAGADARLQDAVYSGYGGRAETVQNAFALALSDEPHFDVLYGVVRDGVVTRLFITSPTERAAEALHRLGTAFGLRLHDNWDEQVDLADRGAVDRYLADEDGSQPQDMPAARVDRAVEERQTDPLDRA